MELELLLDREPWVEALALLQSWGGLQLLDAALQAERCLTRRLLQAQRLGLPLLTALVAGATDPRALAQRLQLPLQQQRYLQQQQDLLAWLRDNSAAAAVNRWSAAEWTEELEAGHLAPEAVALAVVVLLHQPAQQMLWRPLLRWWGRWRHLQATQTAKDLLAQGWAPGPGLGAELRRLRSQRLMEVR
jgi:poly(A) polymerase